MPGFIRGIFVFETFAMKLFSKQFLSAVAGIISLLSVASMEATQVTVGSTVLFSVTADGTAPFTYQWKKDSVDLVGSTGSTLTLTNIQSGNTGNYSVVVVNSAGSTTSDVSAITIVAANVAPAMTTQPLSQNVTAGANVTFTAAASGTPAPTYQWNKDGTAISGATSATLTLSAVQTSAAGTYTVVATNSVSAVTSTGAVLTVAAANFAPAMTTQPLSQGVTVGTTVTFTAAASGAPTPTYQWKKDGTAISGATSATLTLSAVQTSAAGTYTVVATNSVSAVTSTGAVLTVTASNVAPAMTTQPLSQSVTAGATVAFTAAASGTPTPTFQWKKDGTVISGATSATLTLSAVQTSAAGTYTVVATNSVSAATSAGAVLTVAAVTVAPTITTQPQSQGVTAGVNVTLTVAASGTPTPTYQWLKNGVTFSGATNATLILANAQLSTAGTYTVVATNSAGSATSNGAVLVVTAPTATPAMTTQPQSQSVLAGATVSFTAAASGTPTPTYQWQKNGAAISGATSASLNLTSVQTSAAGTYTVVATNSVGSVTSSGAVLTVASVSSAPVITTQPLSQAAFSGSAVAIVAVVSGTPTPAYQWRKDGVIIPGGTNATLNLSNVQLADAGSYALTATNAFGSVITSFARLVVLVPKGNAITYGITAYPSGVTAGGMVSLDYMLTNTGTKAWGAGHYLSVRDDSGTFLAFVRLIGVAPGESKMAKLRFVAPTTPGTYTYHVQALEDGVELFSTESTVTLPVLAAKPNSIGYNATTFPTSTVPGATINFDYTVTNTGTKAWGANHYLILRNGTADFSDFAPLDNMAPGQSRTAHLTFTAPTTSGVYTYHVQALEDGVEFFETEADLTLVVLAPQPNAIVYNRTRSQEIVTPGAMVNMEYSLSNTGMVAWGANHYLSLRDANGTFLAFVSLNGVAPVGNGVASFSFVAPTTPGIYTYYVQALENGVEFFDTQDLVTITVLANPLPNAMTYNATTFPHKVTRGSTINFSYNVTNRGTNTWGANHYLSLRDEDDTFLGFPSLNGIAPGGSKTVNMTFVAPSTPGVYTYRVQGLDSAVEFFAMADTLTLVVE